MFVFLVLLVVAEPLLPVVAQYGTIEGLKKSDGKFMRLQLQLQSLLTNANSLLDTMQRSSWNDTAMASALGAKVAGRQWLMDVQKFSNGTFICKSPNGCPVGWCRLGSNCLYLSKQLATWHKAKEICQKYDSKLAEPFSFNILEQWSKSEPQFSGIRYIWLGASDLETEGIWKWNSGVPVDLSAPQWVFGEPNDYLGNEDCLLFLYYRLLNDEDCNKEFFYACQKKANNL